MACGAESWVRHSLVWLQQSPCPWTSEDTTQNFQLCRVRVRTYSSNMSRIWSKRWCVMGTPVAGSCCWHRLEAWGRSGTGGQVACAPCPSTRRSPAYVMAALSSSIWSRSCWASSCMAARSCCSMAMYSAVFCRVLALLTCGYLQCGLLDVALPRDPWRHWGLVLGRGLTKGPRGSGGASLCWQLTLRLGWMLSVLTSPCRVSNPSLMLKRRFCSAEMCVMRRFSVLWGQRAG